MHVQDNGYYKKLGFKCGLEIHQRLATRHKLFCNCNAMLEEDAKTGSVRRKQRAVAGELGKIDPSTRFESSKEREFIYELGKESTCLVDIDEEPPHELNEEALDVALQICAALNAKVPDEIEPMRKGVVDGSDPSAFQRTMLVGYDGYVEIEGKRIAIPTIFLEEESSGIVRSTHSEVSYDVSRVGVPLIEIDTDPDIMSPDEAKKVAHRIGAILRLTGKVQRGIGSIRQDINVSIREGTRVEIKGFQDLDAIDTLVHNEVLRQERLVELKKKLEERNASVGEANDMTNLMRGTSARIVKDQVINNGRVYISGLRGFAGIIGSEVNPNRRLGSEISDYAKAAGVNGIIHSDEDMVAYGFSDQELRDIRMELHLSKEDAFMLIAAQDDIAKRAMELARHRAQLALKGVVGETRAGDAAKGVTRFMRPLPGGMRMYPETDMLPVTVEPERYSMMSKRVESIDDVKAKLESEMRNPQLAEQMLKSTKLELYKLMVEKTDTDPAFIAVVLLERMKELRRSGLDVESIGDAQLVELMRVYGEGKIVKPAVDEVLRELAAKKGTVESIINSRGLKRIEGKELEKLVAQYKGKSKDEIKREIMLKHRLNVDGAELNALLDKGG